jgi:hypothetical protein
MCGMCHDVSTHQERVDDQGNPLGFLFNEQSTYSEWTRSAFAIAGEGFQSCQDCHMPAVADKAGCESYVEFYAHALGGRRHDLVGPNRFMITLLQRMYGDAGTGDVIDFFFDQAIERTDAFIGTSATLEVDAPAEVHLGEGLSDIAVTVTNETGHKLPTGYSEGRMMWLEVVATYGEQVVWSSGAWDQAEGLQEDAQLRTYQAIAEDIADGTTFHLLRNNHWVEDSRIPPRGLTQDPATDPVGNRYTARPDGTWPHWDQHSYTFAGRDDLADATPNDGQDDALDVRVRLLYLINTPEYVEFLAEANTLNDAGNDVAMLFDTAGGAPPVVVAEQTLTLPIRGFGATAGTTTGDSEGDVTGASDAPATTTPASTADDSMTAADGTETDTAAADGGTGGCSCRSSAGSGWGSMLLLGLFAGRLPRRRKSGMIYSSRNATLATTGPEVVSSLARRARHCR